MRRVLLAVAACLALSLDGHAQESREPDVTVVRVRPALDTEMLQYMLEHQRKEVFERGMALDSRQSEVFWGVYHQFEKEKEQLDAKRLRLLGTYINKFATLTNDEAVKLVKQSGENQQADLALRQKYFKLISKKLNPVVAARFVQLDDMVGMATRLAILGNVPLIGGSPKATEPVSEQPAAGGEPPPAEPAPR